MRLTYGAYNPEPNSATVIQRQSAFRALTDLTHYPRCHVLLPPLFSSADWSVCHSARAEGESSRSAVDALPTSCSDCHPFSEGRGAVVTDTPCRRTQVD